MPKIKCSANDCLHHKHGTCWVTEDTTIDISLDDGHAVCLDYSPVTNREYVLITGKERETTK